MPVCKCVCGVCQGLWDLVTVPGLMCVNECVHVCVCQPGVFVCLFGLSLCVCAHRARECIVVSLVYDYVLSVGGDPLWVCSIRLLVPSCAGVITHKCVCCCQCAFVCPGVSMAPPTSPELVLQAAAFCLRVSPALPAPGL